MLPKILLRLISGEFSWLTEKGEPEPESDANNGENDGENGEASQSSQEEGMASSQSQEIVDDGIDTIPDEVLI